MRFVYDALDRAEHRTYDSATTTYAYQGIGETVAASITGSTTTSYAYDGSGAPMAEQTGAGAVMFHLRDPHGDVVGLVTTVAAEQGTIAYDPYGEPLATSGTRSMLGYQGDLTDPVSALVDMGTRWYAPGSGRFSSRDTFLGNSGAPMTLNRYAYAGMNPATMIDPTGMGQCTMAGECVTPDGKGGTKAVGGNPGAASSRDCPHFS